jgi:zinc transport system permease protein
MTIAVMLGCLFNFLGLGLAYQLNWPPGATIALTSAAFYLLNLSKGRLKVRSSGR